MDCENLDLLGFAVSGYGFRDVIGADWIAREQPTLMAWAADLARRAAAVLVLGTPEADAEGRLFNSLLLFGRDGARPGQHRKINVLKVGCESWSSPGESAAENTAQGRAERTAPSMVKSTAIAGSPRCAHGSACRARRRCARCSRTH